MQSVLAILVFVCFSQVFCGTIVKFDQVQGYQPGNQVQSYNGLPGVGNQVQGYNGLPGVGSVKVESQNKNANLNDINIGSGAGNGGDFKFPNFGWDTDEVKINWNGKSSEECASSTANPNLNPTDGTTSTTTSSTTTISPNCTCQISSIIDPNFGNRNCTFYAEDAKAHCDQKGYSLKRAICVAAMALNWEECTPTNATILFCTCPILKFNRGAHFEVPWHIPPTSRLFYGSRYKTCYRQCREDSETEESTYESDSDAQDTGKASPFLDKKKKL